MLASTTFLTKTIGLALDLPKLANSDADLHACSEA
jgi:hypothetical protein